MDTKADDLLAKFQLGVEDIPPPSPTLIGEPSLNVMGRHEDMDLHEAYRNGR